ncbi:hypothetical protein ACOMHN_040578 [Nucella lapillus]
MNTTHTSSVFQHRTLGPLTSTGIGDTEDSSRLSAEYQLAISVGLIMGISIFLVIVVALLVYRKKKYQQMTAQTRQKVFNMMHLNDLSQVTFNRQPTAPRPSR